MFVKEKKRNQSVPARIVSTNGNEVVVELDVDKTMCKRGQLAVATVSTKGRTLRGKSVVVSDVVAQGPIAAVSGRLITIRSRRNNPIVSQNAATEAKERATKVNVRVVQ
ncbi:hypothetical protein [uncultured Parabacteroides sp.]|uniref:hypothetical protein n=1 Tax=uncultured Parabacteroides sp. TaxID=512312 RepID=UPI000EA23400|nr:hypothetical protein [uncultured Parabacteroides sp.]RKI99552.1 hypothetical protein D7X87_24775 [bacterium D16-54]RKJ09790.1 hypothetical protein D7X65_24630 [bacterium D16-56]